MTIPARLKAFFTLSPFKVGCLVTLAAVLLFASFGQQKPEILQTLDNRLTDTMFRYRGTVTPSQPIVIVDIDEKSLRSIGQWPWPRQIVAKMVHNLGAGGAKVVGLDIVFAESDRTSPKNFIEEMQQLLPTQLPQETLNELKASEALDHDLALGKALAATPSVLGYVFQTQNDGLKNQADIPFPSATTRLVPSTTRYEDISLRRAYRAITNVISVAQGESEGFFNVFPDSAGTVRKVPLFMMLDGVPYPSLALEVARIGLGEQEATIHISRQDKTRGRDILGIELGASFIPTDEQGQITINFRGPGQTYPYLSAAEILAGTNLERVRGKYVLVGTSAAGLLDLRATPFSNIYPGVEVHATIIDNILSHDPFVYDIFTEIGITYALLLIGGLGLSALLAYATPLAGGLGGLLLFLAALTGNYFFFFSQNQLLGLSYPLLTVLAIFLMVTLFNYFFEGQKKRFISSAFGHYVSPQIVHQLLEHPEKLSLQGEEKNLTVLFSDIRGFTSISEKMTSEELGHFMNEYLTAMSHLIFEHKGTVDKFIGDAIMAIWGAPIEDSDHAANCVRAAFRMMAQLDTLQTDWQKRGLPDVAIRIGINTGVMSVGNFGSDQRFDYTVMGDNVNLASRLEGANKTYGTSIAISEYTKTALGEGFYCRLLDLVRVKGKEIPVRIYEPLCEGEPEPELKKETELFAAALHHYANREFQEAAEIILALNNAHPTPLYALYLDRLSHFAANPPPEDWDGAFTFTTK
ncbi:CHASE2 domain-containing protein [Thiovibrio frasassiensis]|jgi:adenylate cyclase|uniref:Adenylate/guanylate cyclase domain-containing protein n=1 Tax=Thiovibrio frasassiensis TaxID=2984131 RepID=A0A9X4RMB0_9BACT|nr:adenylate/guanylate cyclase domain-containing protein [Thiovibrio frasassiensis]MDG4476916.1 adenylate/guanylate cyclase domain-containing protein [Thiovibrio frasassiensis]